MSELGRRLRGFRASTEEVPLGEALALPLVLTAIILVLAALAWMAAGSAQSVGVSGRGLVKLVPAILGGLGPNGVLVLAGVFVAPALAMIASRVTTPPRVQVLARA